MSNIHPPDQALLLLVIARSEDEARRWLAQNKYVNALYVAGIQHVLGSDPQRTRWVAVGTWWESDNAIRAFDEVRYRGIKRLDNYGQES